MLLNRSYLLALTCLILTFVLFTGFQSASAAVSGATVTLSQSTVPAEGATGLTITIHDGGAADWGLGADSGIIVTGSSNPDPGTFVFTFNVADSGTYRSRSLYFRFSGDVTGSVRLIQNARSFYVHEPPAGSTVNMGSLFLIEWTYDQEAFGFPTKVELYKGNMPLSVIANNVTDNEYYWYPDYDLDEGNDYRIVISNIYNTTVSPAFSIVDPRPECVVESVSASSIVITPDSYQGGFINVTSASGCNYWTATTDVSGLTLDLQMQSVGRIVFVFNSEDWTPRQGVITIGGETVKVYINMSPPSVNQAVDLSPIYALLLGSSEGNTVDPTDPSDPNDPGTDPEGDPLLDSTEGMFVVYGTAKTFTTSEVMAGEHFKAKHWTKLYTVPFGPSIALTLNVANYSTILIDSSQTQTPGSSVTHRYDYIGTPSMALTNIQASSNLEGGMANFLAAVATPDDSQRATAQYLMAKTYGAPEIVIYADPQSQ